MGVVRSDARPEAQQHRYLKGFFTGWLFDHLRRSAATRFQASCYARRGLNGIEIFVNGTVGVGRTTTIDAVGEEIAEKGVSHAVIDLDRICQAWPAPDDDPSNRRLELTHLEALAANYAANGTTTLVLAGVLEQKAAVARYEKALAGFLLVIIRLTADEDEDRGSARR
jgi:hypothetical protein